MEVTAYKPQVACIMPCGCVILYGRRFEDGALIEEFHTCFACRSAKLRAQYADFLLTGQDERK